jgi:hypothetical protein
VLLYAGGDRQRGGGFTAHAGDDGQFSVLVEFKRMRCAFVFIRRSIVPLNWLLAAVFAIEET